MFFTLLWVKYRQKYVIYHYNYYIWHNRVSSSSRWRQLNNSHWPHLGDGYNSWPTAVKLNTNLSIPKAIRNAGFPWDWHPWGFKMTNLPEPFFENLFYKKIQALRKSFHGLFLPVQNITSSRKIIYKSVKLKLLKQYLETEAESEAIHSFLSF